MSTESYSEEDDEYRVALISFSGDNCDIASYWVPLNQFSLLKAALGEPGAESFYPREYIEETAEETAANGVHFYPEPEEDEDAS
jgi:hypothetical protein